MTRDQIDYSHGDTGTEPPNPLNFERNGRPNSEYFDWFWSEVIDALNGHAEEFDELDSDDDGVVDKADDADTVDGYDGSELAKNGHDHDSRYLQPEDDVTATHIETREDDPENPSNGRIWIRTDI